MSSDPYGARLETAIAAARRGADELIQRRTSHTVSEKAPKDLVTDADLASQQAIRQTLTEAFPGDAFVGEENGENDPPESVRRGDADAPPCWIVDPLDGTVNYVHGLPGYAVSIGLFAEGQLQLGVILDPGSGELFTARRGQGAHLNGQSIKTSDCGELSEALLVCSFATRVAKDSQEVKSFVNMLGRCRAIRRLGSCALNLCYVAAGRLDGYWASCVKSWDAAAGLIIAEEAGADVTRIDGTELSVWDPQFNVAAGAGLRQQMSDVLVAED
ncbi:inositol monophosphatase family protein [Roseimaritima sediminicola]|uniref:inositol monophosphatase family protein n=1 Tax=Roseimaritima sediminicola TaxID=2662066 RepID=UPI00129830DC|nr:inositol monophosphatase family protein [Roseimaritima sediminicola]